MKKIVVIILLMGFSNTYANPTCESLFEKQESLGFTESVFFRQAEIQRLLKGVTPSTFNFEIAGEKVKVGDLVSIKPELEYSNELQISPIEGIVLGSRIMLNTRTGKSESHIVIYDEVIDTVFHVSNSMVMQSHSSVIGRNYNQERIDAYDVLTREGHDDQATPLFQRKMGSSRTH